MATVQPFAGTRYNPEHVKLGGVLAPPYDVITDAQRDELYGRDLRNIVRIDYGITYPEDIEGVDDQYTRAASFLTSWLELDVLVRDAPASFYVVDHPFQHPDGTQRRRRGVLATVGATPWELSDLRPHERTLRGPKADRLALMRATRAQTSPVFAVWTGAGDIAETLDGLRQARPCSVDASTVRSPLRSCCSGVWPTRNRSQRSPTPCAAPRSTSPTATIGTRLPRHTPRSDERRSRSAPGRARSSAASSISPRPTIRGSPSCRRIGWCDPDLASRSASTTCGRGSTMRTRRCPPPMDAQRLAAAASMHDTHHAFAVVAHDGAAVLRRPRRSDGSPRDRLDVAVLETEVLGPAGVSRDMISGGALAYTRDPGRTGRRGA